VNIEQRMADALTDLREALADGGNLDVAIRQSAFDYDLKPDVLHLRAKREFGCFAEIPDKVAFERAAAASDAYIKFIFTKLRASWGFGTSDDVVPEAFVKSLEKEFEFMPKENPGTLAAEQERAAFFKIVSEAYHQAFNNAPNN
jgi:hypothetical protein